MRKTFWVILSCLILQLSGFTQSEIVDDPFIKYSHITKKNGLSSNYILDFLQDNEGFMWIATNEGLNRYDGYKIKQFLHNPVDSNSISDNLVTSLACLNDSIMLVGTRTGLNFFNCRKQVFSRNYRQFPETEYLENKHIRALLVNENLVWVETSDGELVKMNFSDQTLSIYKHRPPSMVNTYFYHHIFRAPDGKIYLGGRYMGLLEFDQKTEIFRSFKSDANNTEKKRDEDAAVYFVDSQGKYWVGGIDGLYIFDPDSEVFQKKLSISTFSIVEPEQGLLWIATGSGLFRYRLKEDLFVQSIHNDNIANSISHNHLNKLYIDHSGNIWIGTLDGVNIYQPSHNKFRHIYHIPENGNSPVSNHISAIAEDGQNQIWIGTENNGLDIFDANWNRLGICSAQAERSLKLASNAISTLMVDSENDVWVGQWSGRGFNIINFDQDKNKTYNLLENELKADWYHDFLEDADGNYWIGIWGAQGLYQFGKEDGIFLDERYIETPGMLGLPIYSMAFDGTKIWLAVSSQNRFYCFDPLLEKTSFYSHKHYHPYSFSKIDSILAVNELIYFFTNDGIYCKSGENPYNFKRSALKPQKTEEKDAENILNKDLISGEINAHVYDLVKDSGGLVWAATDKGLYKTQMGLPVARYHINDGQSIALLSDTIYSLIYQEPDNLWLGTDQGLVKFSIHDKLFYNFQNEGPKYLSSHLIKFLYEDSKGNLWIGTTNKGLNKLNKKTGEITQYLENRKDQNAFWGSQASCMVEDLNGNLWVGGFGLNKFHPETNNFTHFTTENGLTDNQVMAILCDDQNRLWISTANGLNCLNPADTSFQNFYEKDGLQENEFTAAACKLKNGKLLFGGKNGLNIIDPGKIPVNSNPPEVKLSGFSIFEEDQSTLLSTSNSIHLKYNQNYFSFSFTALDFSDPEQNRFRYKLENFDDNWIDATSLNRVAKYTNVDPGNYTFKVIAANNDGIWNETGVSIPLIIRPPIWRTNIFYAAILIMLIVLVYLWIKYRERQIREQNQYLILEQKLLRSQMNPHFIFNSLSSIQSFIFENDPLAAGSYLSRFSELIRSILYNSREEYITLEKEIKTLQNYLELQQLRYQNKFIYTLIIDPEMEPETMKIPPMLAQPFIENAIEHGLKDLDREGFLKIEFLLHFNTIHIRVEDNGVGIENTKLQNHEKAREHKSLATIITNERINILNKRRKNNLYMLNIHNLKNIRDDAQGTLIEFIIPLDKQT
ncbi:MAG TPA: two-component regulator propeller domain-containing protein [Bacteroidales bacterium]|nr:two-component regulator propeller domain-containing protein [Bacteroidales bacterium]HRX96606.1 two-component regulator propeller domain-containing protein [Bacteroidales bacterium]